jgi:ubiquitin-conjugating enzyme E2 J2
MLAHKRLQKELVALQKDPPQYITARPQEDDILRWHYVIEGAPGTPYVGGLYHGLVRFPHEYPLKPPSIQMYTPNGRFATNTRLCLSLSDFHPESWVPTWSVASILVGLQSFMNESTPTAGSIETSDADKRAYAARSLAWNVESGGKEFRKLFPELVERYEAARAPGGSSSAAAAAAPGAGGSASAAAAAGALAAAPATGAPAAATGAQQPRGGDGGAGVAAAAPDGAGAGGGGGGGAGASPTSGLLILLGLLAAFALLLLQKRREAQEAAGSSGGPAGSASNGVGEL